MQNLDLYWGTDVDLGNKSSYPRRQGQRLVFQCTFEHAHVAYAYWSDRPVSGL